MQFPAWDCQPYDRVSPHGGILAQRLTTLARLSRLHRQRQAADRADDGQRHRAARAGARSRSRRRRCRSRPAMSCRWTPSSPGWSITATTAPRRCASPANTPCAAASSICFRPGSISRCASTSSAIAWNRSAPSMPRPSARCSTCARSIWCRSRNSSSSPKPSAASAWAMSRPFGAPRARRSAL